MAALHSIPETQALIEAVGLRHSLVTIDTWHFFQAGGPWDELDALAAAALAYVQLSDGLPPGLDLRRETMDRRQLPGGSSARCAGGPAEASSAPPLGAKRGRGSTSRCSLIWIRLRADGRRHRSMWRSPNTARAAAWL